MPSSLPVTVARRVEAAARSSIVWSASRLEEERGEGVISTAIAVLIMSFIGVAAFASFKLVMNRVADKTTTCIDSFTNNATTC